MREQLKRLADQPKKSQQGMENSEALRKQAEQLWKNASPEQREQIRELAKEMAKQNRQQGGSQASVNAPNGHEAGDQASGFARNGRPGSQDANFVDTQVKDAQSEGAGPQRVVAEWLGKGKPGTGAVAAPAERDRIVREAVKSGEKAIEERAAPKRFDKLLMDYFKRLPDQVNPGAPGGAPAPATASPTTDGKPAP